MTKITEDITLVEDKDDGKKRCPGCWRELGKAHDEECIVLRQKQVESSKEMSPWLEKALSVQKKHRASRPKRIISPASNPETPPRTPTQGLGKVGDAVDSVYGAVRNKYVGRRLQVLIEGMENCKGMHFRDIPGKRIVIDGDMLFRIQERSGRLVSMMKITFENRVVTQVEFLR